MLENCIFVLPVNILTGVVRRLLGPHNTLSCVLILTTIGSDDSDLKVIATAISGVMVMLFVLVTSVVIVICRARKKWNKNTK